MNPGPPLAPRPGPGNRTPVRRPAGTFPGISPPSRQGRGAGSPAAAGCFGGGHRSGAGRRDRNERGPRVAGPREGFGRTAARGAGMRVRPVDRAGEGAQLPCHAAGSSGGFLTVYPSSDDGAARIALEPPSRRPAGDASAPRAGHFPGVVHRPARRRAVGSPLLHILSRRPCTARDSRTLQTRPTSMARMARMTA
jgi:hypothetical protein